MADSSTKLTIDSYLKARDRRGTLGFAVQFSDVALILGLICVIGLMILPLPSWAIDTLVGANMMVGVMLLLVAIYIGSPVEFTSFPAVLLMTTLFRLALSIATTRMILLEGQAGEIIDTFGRMVAGGNLVVGLVVFLIITVVQFVVVAKGAERVAEVGARFTLDAMPGKQMSIDSDLRSGLIEKDDARRRRRLLSLESQMHGSLDGAMKFVKGDAIAGIIIILINLLGGLAIGVMQKGMSMAEATMKYSVLTIGDGMVTQIPALLAAMAAGLIVTRSSDDEGKEHLGEAIRQQLAAKPRVLLASGAVTALMALIPGFPTFVLISLGAGVALLGALVTPTLRERLLSFARPAAALMPIKSEPSTEQVSLSKVVLASPVVPLLLVIEGPIAMKLDVEDLAKRLEKSVRDLQLGLGVSIPRVALHLDKTGTISRWRLMAYELPISEHVDETNAELDLDHLIDRFEATLRRNVTQFVGSQQVTLMLVQASNELPDLIKDVQQSMSALRCADIIRRLVQEGVSVRNLRMVLEGMLDVPDIQVDNQTLAESVRVYLKRQISHVNSHNGEIRALFLNPEAESELRQALRNGPNGPVLAIDPNLAIGFVASVASSWRADPRSVLLVPQDLRRPLRALIETDLFELAVLAYPEIASSVRVEISARIPAPGQPPAPPLTSSTGSD